MKQKLKRGRPTRGQKMAAYYAARPELVAANLAEARLKDAAPDLLAAVACFVRCADEAIKQGGNYRDDGSCMRLARAAFAKAKGSQ